MALTKPPFGSYPDVTGVVNATAKTEITALINELKTFLPVGDSGSYPGPPSPEAVRSPDFDPLRPSQGEALRAELDGLAAAINAAPVA